MIMPCAGANRDSLSGRNLTVALARMTSLLNNRTINKRKTLLG